MKKISVLLFLCLLGTATFAQLNGGLKGGLNIANYIGDDADGSDPRIGYHIGGYLNFDLGGSIAIQPELLVNSVGSKYSESGTDPDLGDYKIDGAFQLTYISAPVMFVYNVNDK